jgi:membrane dipeptidase
MEGPVVPYPISDCHNDLLLGVRHLRERGHLDPFGDFWLPQLREGGVRFQVLPICTEEQFVGEGALRRALLMMQEARHLAEVHSDSVVIVETAAEVRAAADSDRIAFLLAIEGAEPIGHSLEVLEVMGRIGVRMCSLSWNRRTMMADGIAERDTGGRLTQLGVEAVRSMEELGIMVDVSHLSEAGFFHLAETATKPFIASHSSCRAVTDHPRNLSDEQLAVIRDTGGMVCINAFGPFIAEETPSVQAYVDHVEHAISVVGPDRVALGTDFIEDVADVVDPIFTGLLVDTEIPTTKGLQRPADFPNLVQEVEARLGADICGRVLGSNLIDFLATHLA